jgi:hypothetical protein
MRNSESRELETNEDLRLAIWLMRKVIDRFDEGFNFDDDSEDGLISDPVYPEFHITLESASRILLECKKNHLDAEYAWRSELKAEKEDREAQRSADADELAQWRRRQQSAHAKVSAAVQSGDLVRPDTCSACEDECKPVAHHDDYHKPLDVRWLCGSCHGKHHAENGSAR